MATDHSDGDSDDAMLGHIQQSAWTMSPGLPLRENHSTIQWTLQRVPAGPLSSSFFPHLLSSGHSPFIAIPCLELPTGQRGKQLSTVGVLVNSLGCVQAIGNILQLEELVGLTWTDSGCSALR